MAGFGRARPYRQPFETGCPSSIAGCPAAIRFMLVFVCRRIPPWVLISAVTVAQTTLHRICAQIPPAVTIFRLEKHDTGGIEHAII